VQVLKKVILQSRFSVESDLQFERAKDMFQLEELLFQAAMENHILLTILVVQENEADLSRRHICGIIVLLAVNWSLHHAEQIVLHF
jgi:hypothetical protein